MHGFFVVANMQTGFGGAERDCLMCGMPHAVPRVDIRDRQQQPICDKCDSPLFEASDGSTEVVDIAHQHETVAEALSKFEEALQYCWSAQYTRQLRVITGGGRIRDALLADVNYLQHQGTILDVRSENRGAIVVTLRRD